MSDLIKREDAIDAIGADIDEIDALDPSAGIKKACIRRAIWKVMGVPSADRPQGHWTKTDVATYRCSECGKKQIADDVNELNFCCCCGSQNKVRYKVQMLKGADDE